MYADAREKLRSKLMSESFATSPVPNSKLDELIRSQPIECRICWSAELKSSIKLQIEKKNHAFAKFIEFTCQICEKELKKCISILTELPCRHVFCHKCAFKIDRNNRLSALQELKAELKRYWEAGPYCPMCRAPFKLVKCKPPFKYF